MKGRTIWLTPAWLVNEDGTRKAKACRESCTHEFWVPDGSALIYVSYLKGQQGRTIYRFDPESGVEARPLMMPACSHLMKFRRYAVCRWAMDRARR